MEHSSLEQFVESVSGTSRLRIEHDFGGGFVRLRTSEAERRQAAQDIRSSEDVIIELLRNSRDAEAKHVFVATHREGAMRVFTVIDDGVGIPEQMWDAVFEPRVTSKLDTSHMDAWGLHGRGMALYSIAVNTQSHAVNCSGIRKGTSLTVVSNVESLPEKADQSSFPTFELEESGKVHVRGPKNIVRTICEFAIESRSDCQVFIGSPAEVCAALYSYGTENLSPIDRLFCDELDRLPLTMRIATAHDPEELREIAEALGLVISERTARRIMDDEVNQAEKVLDRIVIYRGGNSSRENASKKKTKSARVTPCKLLTEEKQELAEAAIEAFSEIARKYYLEENVKASVVVRNDSIHITIPLLKSQ